MDYLFGVPKKRNSKKPEEFDSTPVLTMMAEPDSSDVKRVVRKFRLNPTAQVLLNVNHEDEVHVAFAYKPGDAENPDTPPMVANVTGMDRSVTDASVLSKNGVFTHKKMYEHIKDKFVLDTTIEHHFALTLVPENFPICSMAYIFSAVTDEELQTSVTVEAVADIPVAESFVESIS